MCKELKPLSDFMPYKNRHGNIKYYRCRKCNAEKSRISLVVKMSDKYIIMALKDSGHERITPELIILKRNLLQLKRTIKWKQNLKM